MVELLNIAGLARMLSISTQTIRQKMSAGTWPLDPIRIGRQLRWHPEAVEQFLDGLDLGAADSPPGGSEQTEQALLGKPRFTDEEHDRRLAYIEYARDHDKLPFSSIGRIFGVSGTTARNSYRIVLNRRREQDAALLHDPVEPSTMSCGGRGQQ